MIVDLRIYTCKPNHLDAFVALYREHAWPLQQKYLGRCVGWYVTVEGQLNQVVHMWAYDSQADREQRRAAMAADPILAGSRATTVAGPWTFPAEAFTQEALDTIRAC